MIRKIYKFRCWTDDNHKKAITKRELFLASPKDFNDPFDCRIPNSFDLLDTKEKRKNYIDNIVSRNRETIAHLGYNPELEKIRRLAELESNPDKFQNRDNEGLFKSQDEHLGIISFSERFDSTLMWAHYADNHKGFCLCFDEKRMRESGIFGMGGKVNYSKEFPKIDPRKRGMEKAGIQTYTKSIDWSYEKEYRLANYFFPKKAEIKDRIINYPKNCLIEIIIGMKMPKSDKEQIIEIASKMKIPIYQAKQKSNQFIIEKSPVPNIGYSK
ncbi:DUF2971 domain-containing protein [Salegentibacter maritimus]|uniref:DUF2971 domain-containing protein n=1 Tax=Salegentibacter maritimus TaxID=2794347 RepID=A0ABS0TK55_9FLAO|nr:DUF2971 domain-containing protein [Salegentibacter maritimus]MBI6121426.1 DUF2971 domain-containing protein [Salegentibacter maritimus]